MPCYTSSDHPVQRTGFNGKCETTLDTDFINIFPVVQTLFGWEPGTLATQQEKLANLFYNDIKGMSSSKFNVQKTAIANAYTFRSIGNIVAIDEARKVTLDNLLAQIVCWIKKSNAYDGNRAMIVQNYGTLLSYSAGGGGIGSLFGQTTDLPLVLNLFNKNVAQSFAHMCTDGLSAPVLKMPA